MYIVKNYLTDETVAMCSRKQDALAMIRQRTGSNDPILVMEKV
jgi:uncharacterized protein YcbK (DUF882 family)